jgi:hypothetical protein
MKANKTQGNLSILGDEPFEEEPPKELKKDSYGLVRLDFRPLEQGFALVGGFDGESVNVDVGGLVSWKQSKDKDENKISGWNLIGQVEIGLKNSFKISVSLGATANLVEFSGFFLGSLQGLPPNPLFISAITLGGGYNRDFVLPTFDNIDSFVLLPRNQKKDEEKSERLMPASNWDDIDGAKTDKEIEQEIEREKAEIEERRKTERAKIEDDCNNAVKEETNSTIAEIDKILSDENLNENEKKARIDRLTTESNRKVDDLEAEKNRKIEDNESQAKAKKAAAEEKEKRRKYDKKREKDLDTVFKKLKALQKTFPAKKGIWWVAVGLAFDFKVVYVSAIAIFKFKKGSRNWIDSLGVIANFGFGDIESKFYISIDALFSYDWEGKEVRFFAKISPKSLIITDKIKITGGICYLSNETNSFLQLGVPNIFSSITNSLGEREDNIRPTPVEFEFKVQKPKTDIDIKASFYFQKNPQLMALGFAFSFEFQYAGKMVLFNIKIELSFDLLISYAPRYGVGKFAASFSLTIKFKFKKISFRISVSIGAQIDFWGQQLANGDMQREVGWTLIICGNEIVLSELAEMPKEVKKMKFADFKGMLPVANVNREYDAFNQKDKQSGLGADAPRHYASISVNQGQAKAFPEKEEEEKIGWVVDPYHFVLATISTAPSNQVIVLGQQVDQQTQFEQYDPIVPDEESGLKLDGHHGFIQAVKSPEDKPVFVQRPNCPDNKSNTPFLNVHRKDDQHIGLSPMGIKTESIHTVKLYRQADQSEVTNLVVALQIGNFEKGWYGNTQVDVENPHNNKTDTPSIEDALSGVQLMPRPFFPARTKSISFYWLVFKPGNRMHIGKNELPKETPRKAVKVNRLEDLSVDASVGIGLLSALDNKLFGHLSAKGNKQAMISYWDSPLACQLAEEVYQEMKDRGY